MDTEHDPNHPGSNAIPTSKAEHDQLVNSMLSLGLGRFRPKSEHEHRLDLEREMRRPPSK